MAAVLTAGVAACGSSSSGAGSGGAGSGPIAVMVMGTFQAVGQDSRDAAAAIQAKADEVNASGGINGRMLKVIVCDDQLNPNQATTCARKAVSQKVAVVLSPTQTSGFGAQTLPVLKAAGIPVVGEPAVVPTDWTSSNSFPLDPGLPAQYDGVALAFKKAGCRQVGSIQLPVSAAESAVAHLSDALRKIGSTLVKNVKVGETESTYAPQVAQLVLAGARCIAPIIAPPEVAKMMTAVGQSGHHLLVGGVAASFSQTLLTSLGTAGDGILIAGSNYLPTDTQIPAVADMIAAMKKYTPSTTASTVFSTAGWGAATLVFGSVMPTIKGEINAASVTKAMETTTNAAVGTYAPYTFAQDPPVKDFPRLRNSGILTWTVSATVPRLESTRFTDIYKALAS